LAEDIGEEVPDDKYYYERANEKMAIAEANDIAKVPINVKPLPMPSAFKLLPKPVEHDSDQVSSAVRLLTPQPEQAHFEAVSALPSSWPFVMQDPAALSAESELKESYSIAIASIQEKERQLEILLATAQQYHSATIAREVASALAAAATDAPHEKR